LTNFAAILDRKKYIDIITLKYKVICDKEEMMNEEERIKEARERVKKIKGFYTDLWTYVGVNVMLILINLITSPHELWFYWVTIFWGIAVTWHAIKIFGKGHFDREWEERKVKEMTEKGKEEK
jgi:hypothetical protein